MKKYILGSIVAATFLVGCGSGGGGGPEAAAATKAENTMLVTVGDETGEVIKYKAYDGTGDKILSVPLQKEGLYIISFAHQSYSDSKKIEDAILTIKKDGKVVQYLTRKSLDNLEEDTRIFSDFFVFSGENGTYSFEIDTPESLDDWIVNIGHKDDFPDNLKTVLEDKTASSKLAGSDILYEYQWHLKNTGQDSYAITGAIVDEDIDVEPVWNGTSSGTSRTGQGIKVAVVDEGVEINHPDLIDNIDLNLSWNYLSSSHDTTPSVFNAHGTAVAGIIAAKANNGIGGRGVAPDATIVSYNMLDSQSITSGYFSLPLESLTRNIEEIDIYNNSWGYTNADTGTLFENEDSSSLYYQFANQLEYGTIHGRPDPRDPTNTSKKKGAIYVKSAGNDRDLDWNANYNPEQVERFMIVVGASDADGTVTNYSTPGTNVLLSAPGGGTQYSYLQVNQQMIVTTDLTSSYQGYDAEANYDLDIYHYDVEGNENYDYTNRMNGTSSAGPIVSGVVALMLEENPKLSWREVRYILAKTAERDSSLRALPSNNIENWDMVYDEDLGFGRVNANLAVQVAKLWESDSRFYNAKTLFRASGGEKSDYMYQNSIVESTYSNYEAFSDVVFQNPSTDLSYIDYVNVQFSIDTVSQEEYSFSNDNITEFIEDGVYTVSFNIAEVKDEDGNVLNIPGASISIGDDVTIHFDIEGGAISEEIVLKGQTINAGTKNITPNFNGIDVNSSNWTMSITKGADMPNSNKFRVTLVSPDGTHSEIMHYDTEDDTNGLSSSEKFVNTRFGVNRYLDSTNIRGEWKLGIDAVDLNDEKAFKIEDARIEIYGR